MRGAAMLGLALALAGCPSSEAPAPTTSIAPASPSSAIEGMSCLGHVATLVGTPANDHVTGTAGRDVFAGGDGDDTFDGRGGDDIACGGAGDDVLRGGRNADRLVGGAGLDELRGQDGTDRLSGGLGDDVIGGGRGVDTIDFVAAPDWIDLDLLKTGRQPTNGEGDDVIRRVENVIGSPFDDKLRGSHIRNRIDGRGGDDYVLGRAERDVVIALAGADYLDPGAGRDTVDYSRASSAVRIDLRSTEWQDTGGGGMDRFFSVERLVGTRFADVLIGTDPDATPLTGNEDNELRGGPGPDRLFGVGGPDLLDGGPGVDRCRGGLGEDWLIRCET